MFEADLRHFSTSVRAWLLLVCVTLVTMIAIGGITRLTGSGLSITDWQPIMGAIPPLSEAHWEIAFEKYKAIPQYREVNSGMDLDQFKFIYFWEWFHRLIGRLIGLVVLIPGIVFYLRGMISSRLAKRALIGFLLGGLQGALGWFMVQSGLTERVSVSHYRLAAHLGLALVILAYFVDLTRSVFVGRSPISPGQENAALWLRPKFRWLVALFALQIVYGAFVAGMKAGFAFNTFPLMAGSVIPPNLFELDPLWRNAFDNPATVQWIHRTLGWIVFGFSNFLWLSLVFQRRPRGEIRREVAALAHLTILQFAVGIATLVMAVPVFLGVLHQLGAALIVSMLALLAHSLRRSVPRL